MSKKNLIQTRQEKLKNEYRVLVEQAYNLRETDHARSDGYEFEALKLLNEINQLTFLSRENLHPAS